VVRYANELGPRYHDAVLVVDSTPSVDDTVSDDSGERINTPRLLISRYHVHVTGQHVGRSAFRAVDFVQQTVLVDDPHVNERR
jgi:hypothetical protein